MNGPYFTLQEAEDRARRLKHRIYGAIALAFAVIGFIAGKFWG